MKFGSSCGIAPRPRDDAPGRRDRAALGSLLAALLGLTSACTTASPESAAPITAGPGARIIVRFRPRAPDPADPAFRARLARAAGVEAIDLIRPMSGNAFVMRVACPHPTDGLDPCAGPLARLRAVDEVVDVEIDARETVK